MTREQYLRCLRLLLGKDCAKVRAANTELYGAVVEEDDKPGSVALAADLILAEAGVPTDDGEEQR